MNKSKLNKTNDNIGWAGHSFNPVTGCLGPDGDGKLCPYCYANAMTQRFGQSFKPTFYPERYDVPVWFKDNLIFRPQEVFIEKNAF